MKKNVNQKYNIVCFLKHAKPDGCTTPDRFATTRMWTISISCQVELEGVAPKISMLRIKGLDNESGLCSAQTRNSIVR